MRIPPFNTTILSGDIAGTPSNHFDDVWHVVTIGVIGVVGTTSTTGQLLNGLVIENGNADGDVPATTVRGGGLRSFNASDLRIEECTFRENWGKFGAGLYLLGGDVTMKFCLFEDNVCNSDGAGAFFQSVQSHSGGSGGSEVHNTIFRRNKSDSPATDTFDLTPIADDGRGGAVFVSSFGTSTLRFVNCLLTANKATQGGAVYLEGASFPSTAGVDTEWVNCTFGANKVWAVCDTGGCTFQGEGRSFYVEDGGTATFKKHRILNTISWMNGGGTKKEAIFVLSDDPLVSYSDIETDSGVPWPGTNNIHANPLFERPILDWELLPTSPCVDTGDNAVLPDDWTDLDDDGVAGNEEIPWSLKKGRLRVKALEAGPAIVDMGAHELQNKRPVQ